MSYGHDVFEVLPGKHVRHGRCLGKSLLRNLTSWGLDRIMLATGSRILLVGCGRGIRNYRGFGTPFEQHDRRRADRVDIAFGEEPVGANEQHPKRDDDPVVLQR